MSGGVTWYLARSLGIVAYALLTASMLWGLWLSTRTPARQGRAWLLEIHRVLGGLAVLFVLGHLGALVLDNYIAFDLVDLLVPFASDWQPRAVAWGVLGFYLLAAVEVTSLLRRTLTRRSWRKVHLAAFAAYLMATAHFLTAGTDAGGALVLSLTLGGVTLVVTGTLYRIVQHLTRPRRVPIPTKERSWSSPPPPTAPPNHPAPLLPSAPAQAASPPHPRLRLPSPPPGAAVPVRSLASAGGPSPSAPPPSPPPAA